jgi:hypothetical protein
MNKDFLIENKDAFEKLARIIREIDTVRGVDTLKEFQARNMAIDMILSWVEDLWGIEKEQFDEFYKEQTKESGMFKYRDTE